MLIALTPATRMCLCIVQMQFIFLNTKVFEMKRHKVIVRFGLMHMLATNLCEWLYVLVEETRHEISNNIDNATGIGYSRVMITEHRDFFGVFILFNSCASSLYFRCKCGEL